MERKRERDEKIQKGRGFGGWPIDERKDLKEGRESVRMSWVSLTITRKPLIHSYFIP